MEEIKRTFTEEEITKFKKHDRLIVIAHYLLLAVVIGLLFFIWTKVETLDGMKCVSDPCNFCQDRFKEVTCTSGIRTQAGKEINIPRIDFNFSNDN